MVKKRTTPTAWSLSAILAVTLLGGIGLLGHRLRPYWVAKYRGYNQDLRGTMLIFAPLADADLRMAKLQAAMLTGAQLRRTNLCYSNLTHASLDGADLQGAYLFGTDLSGVDLRGADLSGAHLVGQRTAPDAFYPSATLTGARYDTRTRWPAGFDPLKHGAILVR